MELSDVRRTEYHWLELNIFASSLPEHSTKETGKNNFKTRSILYFAFNPAQFFCFRA